MDSPGLLQCNSFHKLSDTVGEMQPVLPYNPAGHYFEFPKTVKMDIEAEKEPVI